MNEADTILQHIGQLAREYDRKFRELEAFAQGAQPEALITQVKALGERTTDRFRAAQQALLTLLTQHEQADREESVDALMALSSCFDELRILLQILLQRSHALPG